jgi:hypothetical protein
MKRLLAVLLLLGLCGCSAAQLRQEFIGYSINDVKTSKNKQTQNFDMSGSDCVAKIKELLKEMRAIVREDRRKQYLVADNFQYAFRSAIDTTAVGILVTSRTANKCDVEIASDNPGLAIFVSGELSKKLNPRPEEEAVK